MTAPPRVATPPVSPGTRWLCICADDFGMTAGVNAAVLELVEAGTLSATGCMVRRDAWPAGAAQLRGIDPARCDVGLHLDLTGTRHGGATDHKPTSLIARGYLGLLPRAAMRSEIRDQLARFEDAMGRVPAFIDGHQHVHQLRGVREVLLAELAARYAGALPWVRSTAPVDAGRGARGKQALIFALGGAPLARQAARHGLATNGALLGVYDFSGSAADYRARLEGWLAACRSGDVLMCHPSRDMAPDDSIAAARRNEYEVLRGLHFPQPVPGGEVAVAPLSRWLGR
ncbi:MAG: YdjC family protein [Variovorax sp.]|nr:YdjC family protein [Variovorax sp.]